MRILIHSNGPHVPTGYGQQCALLVRQLKAAGHDVAVSCLYGLAGQPITWDGTVLYPAGKADFSPDVLAGHAEAHEADLVLFLMDFRKMGPIAQMIRHQPWKAAAWMPVDTHDRLGRPDHQVLRASGAFPVAMSRHGLRLLQEAGFTGAAYVPHCVDTTVFRPPADRDALREAAGVADRFVIGINAANMDAARKSFPEQFQAFADFRANHGDALLLVHSQVISPLGLDLFELVEDFGIGDAVRVTDQYVHTAGLMSPARMAEWYGTLDVLSLCSYAEGFGVPLIEAQACGVPVVTADASATAELRGAGWLVPGDRFWNPVHRAYWVRPRIGEITAAYEQAYQHAAELRGRAVEFARAYDTAETAPLWDEILAELEKEPADAA